MSKTVYSVSTGEYSDYTVVALFTKKEDAEALADAANQNGYGYCGAFVEEFQLDPEEMMPRPGWWWRLVRMKPNGDVIQIDQDVSLRGDRDTGFLRDINGNMYTFVMSDSDERAIKVAGERRRESIAMGTWCGKDLP